MRNAPPRSYDCACFRCSQRAFISSDNFFLAAGLMGRRAAAFLGGVLTCFGADLPLHFAHRCFMAASAVKVNCAVCDSVPLVASTVMGEAPTVAESATLNSTGWFVPTAIENDDDGEAVSPSGIPCSVIPTEPVKPFCAVTVMVSGEVVAPTSVETDEGKQRH